MKTTHYQSLENDCVKCRICPRECTLDSGEKGFCRGRVNRQGELHATNYGEVSAIAVDPIEKKPLFHFYPGKDILSIGTTGCNLRCQFCQNWHIAQKEAETRQASPEQIVNLALKEDSLGLAYTYSEPLVWYEFILDTAREAKEAGLKNVLVTNGFINQEPLEELLQYIDGMNLDIKAFNQEFYQKICGGGDLEVVKDTARLASENCLLEVTTLIIPGLNDDPEEIDQLAKWLAQLDKNIPLHLSRYYPQYEMDIPATDIETMRRAKEIAEKHLNYVYLGNIAGADRNTYCHNCGNLIVERKWTVQVHLEAGKCPNCGVKIPIIQ